MCLIIRTETDKPLNRKLLDHMQSRNRDGFGFMWIQDNKLKTFKSFVDDNQLLWDKYEELKEFNPFIHLRFKTHGAIDHTNTHPYPCGHGIYMMHNGIMNVDDSDDRTKSDTWHFIDQLIKPVLDMSDNPHETLRSKKFRKLIDNQLGSSNRMVFGDRGGFVIFGEKNWHTVSNEKTGIKGLLVSNTYAWSAQGYDPNPKPVHNHKHQTWVRDELTGHWMVDKSYKKAVDAVTTAVSTTVGSPSGRIEHVPYVGPPTKSPLPTNPQSAHYLRSDPVVLWNGKEYEQIHGNIYQDDDGKMFFNNGRVMVSRPDLDKTSTEAVNAICGVKTLQPVTTQLVIPGTEEDAQILGIITKPEEKKEILVVKEYTEDDYMKALAAEWCTRQPWEVATMVYTEPDDAAKVISYLVKNGAHRV